MLYYVARGHRGAGYGGRAVLVLQHAFADLVSTALLADVILKNTPRTRLLEKLGFDALANGNSRGATRDQSN
ncbi:MAG: GNAT family N-acetyltransferase [Chloroflexi bacterium]|nr:MAG: GNAT family N-acetyltransferase [Chloroflexota bacterium]